MLRIAPMIRLRQHYRRQDAQPFDRNRCGGITYKFCARVEMMSSVAD
jgi:hypothetical protein